MRLSLIKNILYENRRSILISSFMGGFIGLFVFYFYPFGYETKGSVFVTRTPDLITREEFTYEGYYAQSAASDYSKTVVGLFESVSLKRKVLEDLGTPVTRGSIMSLSRNLKVRKKAPQVIMVSFTGFSPSYSKRAWNSFVNNTIETSFNLNKDKGDPNLFVLSMGDPVVLEVYKDPLLFSLTGFFLGAFACSFAVFGKSKVL